MAKIVKDIQNVQRSVLAMVYMDGSLAIECSYFADGEDHATLFHKLDISPEGAEVLRNMLVRDAQLRIGADEAGQNGACQHNFVVSSNKEWYAECVKCGMKVAPF
jgi:hypothetical protein